MGRIAIVGAGMAGLSCARGLHEKGHEVTVCEKSRGLGGRLATRRADGLSFDHGAPSVTANSQAFTEFLAELEHAGSVVRWHPRSLDVSTADLYVGQPGMSGLLKPLTDNIDLRLGARIEKVNMGGSQWRLSGEDGTESEAFDALVLAVPAQQAVSLLGPYSDALPGLKLLTMAPCWSLMAVFRKPVPLAFDIGRPTANGISWVIRNSSKPGRPQHADQWVIHASSDWSADHIEAKPTEVSMELIEGFRALCGAAMPTPSSTAAHRWRYAFTETPLGQDSMWNGDLRLGLVGDWCLGNDAESAFLSGSALSKLIC